LRNILRNIERNKLRNICVWNSCKSELLLFSRNIYLPNGTFVFQPEHLSSHRNIYLHTGTYTIGTISKSLEFYEQFTISKSLCDIFTSGIKIIYFSNGLTPTPHICSNNKPELSLRQYTENAILQAQFWFLRLWFFLHFRSWHWLWGGFGRWCRSFQPWHFRWQLGLTEGTISLLGVFSPGCSFLQRSFLSDSFPSLIMRLKT